MRTPAGLPAVNLRQPALFLSFLPISVAAGTALAAARRTCP
jgi:hypothetical protein